MDGFFHRGTLLFAILVSGLLRAEDPPRLVLEAPAGAPFSSSSPVPVAVYLEAEVSGFKYVTFGLQADAGARIWFSPSAELIALPGVDYVNDRILDVRRVAAGLGSFDFADPEPVVTVGQPRLRLGTVILEVESPGSIESRTLGLSAGRCRCTAEAVMERPVLDLGRGGQVEPQGSSLRLSFGEHDFRRGDANQDGRLDVGDAGKAIASIFLTGTPPPCPDAADVNDDGTLDVNDPVQLLSFLFLGGPPPRPPYPAAGPDPTPDRLPCPLN